MYLKVQNDGDNYNHKLVIEAYGDKKFISLDWMENDYHTIIREIGKYYWNWEKKKNNEINT